MLFELLLVALCGSSEYSAEKFKCIQSLFHILKFSKDPQIIPNVQFLFPFHLSKQKERNPEKDLWRNSWGSNQSFVGKDDFWLALQSNYNYIMDTHLIDSCREARGELERNYSTETSHTDHKKVSEC